MVSFHLFVESQDHRATSPGDIILMLRKVIHELQQGQSQGEIINVKEQFVGEWSLDMEDDCHVEMDRP